MKIFLTGATGAVGRPALRALIADGHEVTALARSDIKRVEVEAAGGHGPDRSTCSMRPQWWAKTR